MSNAKKENYPDRFPDKIASNYIDDLSVSLWVYDVDHERIVWANSPALKLWDASSIEELRRRDFSSNMSVTISQLLKKYQQDFSIGKTSHTDVWTFYPNGTPITSDTILSGYKFSDGRIGILCQTQVLNQKTPESIRSSVALLHTSVMISLYESDGKLLYRNPATLSKKTSSLPHLKDGFSTKTDYKFMISELKEHGECRLSARMITLVGIRWHEITARTCMDNVSGKNAFILSETDITELKETEQQASYLADHDTLTGLPNRNYVTTRTARLIQQARANNEKLAFLLIDIDRFKNINDTLGHSVGDELLVQVSKRLLSTTGGRGIVARLGGDEFLICLKEATDQTALQEFCDVLIKDFHVEFIIGERELLSTLSIGVSRFPDDGDDLHSLLKHADVALYEAKDEGRNTFCSFNYSLREKLEEKLVFERDLKQAISEEQFELFYQPRIDTSTNTIVGAEALIRWNHPTRGLLTPNLFIEAAEEMGFIYEIGNWVLNKAATEQYLLEQQGHDISISLNVSPKQFDSEDFYTNVLTLQERTGCTPEKIELEITETTLMSTAKDVTGILTAFKDRGFGIAIDDFGTGYSNLACIQDYPITSLKIDRSFIQTIGTNDSVTQMIISLCKLLKVKAVAEGVETEAQRLWLKNLKCDEYQGFLYSRAIPPSDLRELLNKNQTGLNQENVILNRSRNNI